MRAPRHSPPICFSLHSPPPPSLFPLPSTAGRGEAARAQHAVDDGGQAVADAAQAQRCEKSACLKGRGPLTFRKAAGSRFHPPNAHRHRRRALILCRCRVGPPHTLSTFFFEFRALERKQSLCVFFSFSTFYDPLPCGGLEGLAPKPAPFFSKKQRDGKPGRRNKDLFFLKTDFFFFAAAPVLL